MNHDEFLVLLDIDDLHDPLELLVPIDPFDLLALLDLLDPLGLDDLLECLDLKALLLLLALVVQVELELVDLSEFNVSCV